MRRVKKSIPDNLTVADWARLAAFIDGEGCVTIGRQGKVGVNGRSYALTIRIGNTDPRLMVWLKRFGVGSFHDWEVAGQRHFYAWYVSARQAADVLVGCLPYLVIKRDQAELGIAFQATKQWRGGKGVPEETRQSWREMSQQLSVLKQPQPVEVIQ